MVLAVMDRRARLLGLYDRPGERTPTQQLAVNLTTRSVVVRVGQDGKWAQ